MSSLPPPLFAPWRMDYIRCIDKGPAECFLCAAGNLPADATVERKKELLVLWRSEHCVVLVNRYPYTNGHLLIAPLAHKAELEDLSDAELIDLTRQTAAAVQLLKRAISPQGFNVGINLGRAAGAGVPGHLHQHVVPRWNGDTNFMSVVGECRVVPQAMSQLWDELVREVGG
ncbi:MAG TPA: HIT domain-containing protein [Tepidisphaeraceae bacterium]|nr:HIT domain-containing protein [Tepidisphaeraceae bacterium]